MRTTTEKGYKIKIRAACQGVGTYRAEFEPLISRLAELYRRREIAKNEFQESGCKTLITMVNKTGGEYTAKNPLLVEIDSIDKNILMAERELGLTPAAINRINEAALGKKPVAEDDPLTAALSGLRLVKGA